MLDAPYLGCRPKQGTGYEQAQFSMLLLLLFLLFTCISQHGWGTTAVHLGFSFRGGDLPAYLVTPVLFLGPLYGLYLSRDLPFMAHWTFNEQVKGRLNWIGIRNYIVVSASPPKPYELFNHACALTGAHIRRGGLAFMFNLYLPPCRCLKYLHSFLHTCVIRIRCALSHTRALT